MMGACLLQALPFKSSFTEHFEYSVVTSGFMVDPRYGGPAAGTMECPHASEQTARQSDHLHATGTASKAISIKQLMIAI